MNKLTCIIVDDEPLALDILEDYVRRTPALDIAGRFTGGAEALKFLKSHRVDIAFLDIQMPGMGGLDVAKLVPEDTRVVFTTAFAQYAVEGFRVDALDYLLKPVSFAEFTRAVEKAAEWFALKRPAATVTPHLPHVPTPPQTLIVKSDYKQFVIPIDTIVCIEGIRDYIRIHTLDGSGAAGSIQTLMNMKTVEEMLPASRFARVHRSWIVNLDRVKRIERTRIVFDEAALPSSATIPISDTYKEAFLKALAARAL